MTNTLTYDPTELPEGELSAEELDSLQVGEQLAQQQEELLAGKYRNAEELEAAYIELQRKLGDREAPDKDETEVDDTTDEPDVEVTPGVALIQEASNEYYSNNGQLSPETLAKFGEMSSQELVQAYMQLQAQQPQQDYSQVADLTQAEVNVIQNSVGGEAAYQNLVNWAGENLPADYVQAFDNVVESGNLQAIQLAVAGLRAEYENAVGYEGRLLSGKAANQTVDVFRSQAEVVRAMNDPRYDNDPAYRQDVFDKLERSSIQY